ncbi:MAG: putative sensor domain DACNV-containing protein [Hyalangium sp.]|uniref:putative sensor domain DACNV-containing protein n=1 Tax=Hyalangium sp. TaxID=2028555 RepID=UPI00389A66BA
MLSEEERVARRSRLYPSDRLLTEIDEAWKEPDPGESDEPLPLPPADVLEELLHEAYHASLMMEESRRVRFRLVYGQEQALREEASVTVVKFGHPVPFDADGIRRLAPATDPAQVAIGVWAEAERASTAGDGGSEAGEQARELRTWGLVDTGSSWVRFLRGEAYSSAPPPGQFTLASNEPGDLTVSRAGRTILRLRHGALTSPILGLLQSGPIAERFQPAVEELARAIAERVPEAMRSPVGRSWVQRIYVDCIRRILLGIRDLGHGGALLIVPDTWELAGPELSPCLRVKFPCDDRRLWERAVGQVLSKLQSSASTDAAEQLSDAIRFISALCAVDGAVVLTDRLRLLGFGAEITVINDDLKKVHVAKDYTGKAERQVPIESFGTRHRSSFRFCHQKPEGLAFVMSQDGGIKAVKRHEDQVVVWSDIDVESGFDVETSSPSAPAGPEPLPEVGGGGV